MGKLFPGNCRTRYNWTSYQENQPSREQRSKWVRISSSTQHSLSWSCKNGFPCSGTSICMLVYSYYSRCRNLHAPLAINQPFHGCDKLGKQWLKKWRRRSCGTGIYSNHNWNHYIPIRGNICSSTKYMHAHIMSRTSTDSWQLGNLPWKDMLVLLQMEFYTTLKLLKYSLFLIQLAMSYQRSRLS